MDDLTWPSGLKRTRARVAAEYYLGTQRLQTRLHEMNIPFIAFHGRDDPMTDPESSALLYKHASCEDKSLEWVDNVFHDLMHEKPTSDRVVEAIVDWIGERTVEPASKKAKTTKNTATSKTKSLSRRVALHLPRGAARRRPRERALEEATARDNTPQY